MTLEGVFQNGAVVLPPDVRLPEGTRVQVIVPDSDLDQASFQDFLELAGTVDDLPSDMALNHDHYLHGQPKK